VASRITFNSEEIPRRCELICESGYTKNNFACPASIRIDRFLMPIMEGGIGELLAILTLERKWHRMNLYTEL